MYIEPNTIIKVFSYVPIMQNGEHTLIFETLDDQLEYFNSLTPIVFKEHTYQRVTSNSVRVQKNANAMYGCNYMAFQNTSFGTKWFYAFIEDIKYINNETAEIIYNIDWYQSYMTNVVLQESFVEREHVEDDTIGAHTVPEDVDIGELFSDYTVDKTDTLGVMFWHKENSDLPSDQYKGQFYNNLYSTLKIKAYSRTEDLENVINNQVRVYGENDNIVLMCAIPSKCATGTTEHQPKVVEEEFFIPLNNKFGNYYPSNNKLFTYPYVSCCIDNFNGTTIALQYELSGHQNNIHLKMLSVPTPTPSMIMYPKTYKGIPDNYSQGVELTNFPFLPYPSSTFADWVAQGGVYSAITSGISGVNTAMNNMERATHLRAKYKKNMAQRNAMMSAVDSVSDSLISSVGRYVTSTNINGSIPNAGIMTALGKTGFRVSRNILREEYARIIDGYFTRFGYKVNELKKPNLFSRSKFNYIKTVDCKVTGNAPSIALESISAMFDNGVTLWHTPNVHDYSNNTIVIQE